MNKLLVALGLLVSPTLLNAEQRPLPTPVVEPFAGEKYKEIRWDPMYKGYFSGEVYVTPSREWIVFAILGNFRVPDRPDVVALGAYHVSSGRKRQLVFSPSLEESAPTVGVLAGRHGNFVPLGHNRVGIVAIHLPPHLESGEPATQTSEDGGATKAEAPDVLARGREKYFLWRWDLDRDTAGLVGPWHHALVPVARTVQLGSCSISWRPGPITARGDLKLRDLASGKKTSVALNLAPYVPDAAMQTFAPTADPCAFAVCDPVAPEGLRVYCVDANAPTGIRWKIDKAALETAVGRNVKGGALLPNVAFPCRRLPLMVYSVGARDFRSHLMFLDEKTGEITGQLEIPDDELSHRLPIISADSGRLVIVTDHPLKENATKDPLRSEQSTRLRVVDLDTGKYRETTNLHDRLPLCRMRGFLNPNQAVVSDEHAVWVLDTGKGLKLRELFRLNRI